MPGGVDFLQIGFLRVPRALRLLHGQFGEPDDGIEGSAQLMAEVRPISFLPLDNASSSMGDDGDSTDLNEIIPDEGIVPVTSKMEKDEVTQLVAERINQLPEVPRKVLAMYYFQDMRLAEIAEVFGLTESRICQIHSQAIISLRSYITCVMHK